MTSNFFPQDPRVYVRDELQIRQKRRPQYSMRAFARDLEISPSFLCEFLAGRQGLSRARALWVAEKIKLSNEQSEHFWDLLQSQFGQPQSAKASALVRARDRSKNTKSHMNLAHFHLVADWYSFVLLELLGLGNGPKKLDEISEILNVPVVDLDAAVERLVSLGFLSLEIAEDGSSIYQVQTELTTVGDEVDDRAVQISHQECLRMHANAIDHKSFAERENLTASFSIRQAEWPALRREMVKALVDVIAKFGASANPKDQVITLTMQMMTLLKDIPCD